MKYTKEQQTIAKEIYKRLLNRSAELDRHRSDFERGAKNNLEAEAFRIYNKYLSPDNLDTESIDK